jgi:hypothetical protein
MWQIHDNLIEIYHVIIFQAIDGGKKSGHEMQGVVINILFIFLSAEHDRVIHLFGGYEFGIERVNIGFYFWNDWL